MPDVGIKCSYQYTIRSLQGYPGELVQSSGTDITLDDVLMILDENYNNVKALDALNQELFQLWMADKETAFQVICRYWQPLFQTAFLQIV